MKRSPEMMIELSLFADVHRLDRRRPASIHCRASRRRGDHSGLLYLAAEEEAAALIP